VQVLLDYMPDFEVDGGLFGVPSGYQRIEMSELAPG